MHKPTTAVACLVLVAVGGVFLHFRRAPDADPASRVATTALPQPATPSTAAPSITPATPAPTFADWTTTYQQAATPAARAALEQQGIALAQSRRERMKHLIQTDPQRALAEAVPFAARQQLPVAVQALLEQPVSGRGFYGVRIASDFETGTATVTREARVGNRTYQAFVYGRRTSQTTKENIPLHGIALDGLIALDENPVRVVTPAEAAGLAAAGAIDASCPVSGQPVAATDSETVVDVGGEFHYLCRAAHLNALNDQLIAQESVAGPTTAEDPPIAQDSWTQGVKTLLLIRVTYADTPGVDPQSETSGYSMIDGCNTFFLDNSWGTYAVVGTVTPLLVLPQTEQWYKDNGDFVLYSDARELAAANGYDYLNYHLDAVRFNGGPGSYGGQAYVGGRGCWLKSSSTGVAVHEFGHNLGLWHANYWTATGDSVIGPGSNSEYGDSFDTMGAANAGNYHFNAMHRNKLDWLPNAYVATITTSGTYRVYAFDVAAAISDRTYALKIRKDFDRDYWLNVRQRFASNHWLLNGVELHWDPWTSSASGTHLLDTTPGSVPAKNDSAVFLGRTFSDPGAGIHLTPLARTGSGEETALDVVVNLGSFSGNAAPTVTLSASQTSVAPGASVSLTAAATDGDGDTLAYAWDFGDNTYGSNSVNAANVNYQWPAAGEYAVRCVVSDMKGHTASDTVVITVGSPATRQITGQVLDANNEPVEGVRLTAGGVTASYTESDGSYVITNLPAGTNTIAAAKYGYSFAAVGGWVNPVDYTAGSVAGIDFLATPAKGVSIAAVDAFAAEAGGDTGLVRITRTGPTTAALSVKLRTSGTASYASDHTTSPPLTGSVPYAVTIPAGAATVDITLTPVNDSTSEGTEAVTVGLWEDSAYAITGPAEATITIADDEAYTKPTIWVYSTTSAGDNLATESGDDYGVYQLNRSGNVSSNLTVFFTMTGTASNGLDYATLGGSAVIPAGQTQALVPLSVLDDALVEGDETATLTLTSDPAYTLSTSSATLTIGDDDPPSVTLGVTDNDMGEPSNSATFRVTRAGNRDGALVVTYAVSGTASNGVDYTTPSGSVTIPAGSATATFTITPKDDTAVEGDEVLVVTLQSSAACNIANPAVYAVILRDNELPTVTVGTPDATAAEAGGGTNTASFSVSRTGATTNALTVYYTLAGEAVNGADYPTLPGTIVIPAGASAVTNVITVTDDALREISERIRLTLAPHPSYNPGSTVVSTITITDDDLAGVIAVGFTLAASNQPENGGSKEISVSFSAASASPVSVDYSVTGGSATGSGTDYTLANGTFANVSNALTKTFYVSIVNDSLAETNETILITLSNPVGAVLDAVTTHELTILDDDVNTLTVNATDANAAENGPDPGNFRVSRTGSTAEPVTFQYQLLGTAGNGADYAAIPSTATIPAGASFLDLPVVTVDDPTEELAETAMMKLLTVPGNGYKLGSPASATVTILDNDAPTALITVAATDPTAAELGSEPGTFTLTRNGAANGELTVAYAVSGTASNGVDYAALNGSVVFGSNVTSAALTVTPIDDLDTEGSETVQLNLLAGAGYGVGSPAAASVTIADDEENFPPTVTITNPASYSAAIPAGVGLILGATATDDGRPNPPGALTYHWQSFAYPEGAVAFSSSNTLATTAQFGTNGYYYVQLIASDSMLSNSALVSVFVGMGQGGNVGPFVDAGAPASIPLSGLLALDGTVTDDGLPDGVTGGPAGGLRTRWSKVTGPGTVAFGDAALVDTTAGFDAEGVYVLRLQASDGQIETFDELTVTVTADPPVVAIAATTDPASEWGLAAGGFTVTRTGDTNDALQVQVEVSGTASNGVDYTAISTPAIIPAGAASALVSVTPLADTWAEGEELITLTLQAAPGYALGASTTATVHLQDLPMDHWRHAQFTAEELLDSTVSGDTADHDLDGIVTLLEYALGLEPKVPDSDELPVPAIEGGYLTLTYTRVVAAIDLTYLVEVGNAPGDWQSGPDHTEDIEVIDNGATESVKTRDKTPADGPELRLMRLKVTRSVGP